MLEFFTRSHTKRVGKSGPCSQARTEILIGDLDDGCLLHVLKLLSPLPDLFSCSATCKVCYVLLKLMFGNAAASCITLTDTTDAWAVQRFQHLTTDSRLSVLVTHHKTQEQQRNIGRRVLPTLQTAVDASRSGSCLQSSPHLLNINDSSPLHGYVSLNHSCAMPHNACMGQVGAQSLSCCSLSICACKACLTTTMCEQYSQQPLMSCMVWNRVGDTIVLEAGQLHDAHDVVIPWPLKLIGSGRDAEDTILLCPKGPNAALDFRYGSLLALECHTFCMSI